MSALDAELARLTAAVRAMGASAGKATKATATYRVVIDMRPKTAAETLSTFGLAPTGLFDRISAADRAEIAAVERHVAMLARLFEWRQTGGFDRTTAGERATFERPSTVATAFDRVTHADVAYQRAEMRLVDMISRAHVGF
jgi:hypothetical protein